MNDDGVIVRPAGRADAPDIASIGYSSFKAAYGGTTDPQELQEHLDSHFGVEVVTKEIRAAATTYLLAVLDGQARGFAKIRAGEVPDAVPALSALELQQAYVLPEAQRSGVGGHLIACAADHARREGAEGLWLSVWEEAQWAIRAYLKHGFESVGKTEFRIGNTAFADLLMWRAST